jgi:hypothetical protein
MAVANEEIGSAEVGVEVDVFLSKCAKATGTAVTNHEGFYFWAPVQLDNTEVRSIWCGWVGSNGAGWLLLLL